MSDERMILFDGVGKRYHKRAGTGTMLSLIPGLRRRESDEFWALRDVSFEVKRGECLGIIGSNGAGKSTLLKILSGITPPTVGRYEAQGRLASLIEVGAGFHPDLTGRENVFLNGAILGMTRREILAKFDEIVDFAEVRDFIDVPIKRYSSGMYVRLGFAVAAHLMTDILVVDEVLAVGDAAFQKKCLGKMDEATGGGRTVLFVSHSMPAVQALCDNVIVVEKGRIVRQGTADEMIHWYLSSLRDAQEPGTLRTAGRSGSGRARVAAAEFHGIESGPRCAKMGEEAEVVLDVQCDAGCSGVNISFAVQSDVGIKLFNASTHDLGMDVTLRPGLTRWTCRLGPLQLRPGTYRVAIGIGAKEVLDFLPDALAFEVLPRDVLGSGRMLSGSDGVVYFPYEWTSVAT